MAALCDSCDVWVLKESCGTAETGHGSPVQLAQCMAIGVSLWAEEETWEAESTVCTGRKHQPAVSLQPTNLELQVLIADLAGHKVVLASRHKMLLLEIRLLMTK